MPFYLELSPILFVFTSVNYGVGIIYLFLKISAHLAMKQMALTLITHSIVISRHQSAWETIFLAAYIKRPIFILKRELLMIPLFGWCLYLLKNISINRSDGVSSLKKIMKACDEHVDNDRTLIIFPEGTRVNYGKNIEIKKGVLKILDALKLPSIIINHNAGKFWSKDSFLIKPGTVLIETISLPYNADQLISKNKIQEHFL